MRDSFIFYRSFYEAIKDLPRDIQGEIYTAIIEYDLTGEKIRLKSPISHAIFVIAKSQIDLQGKPGGFKGAQSDELKLIRCSAKMREWRKLVFERDDYTCQICGKKGGNLNAHILNHFPSSQN